MKRFIAILEAAALSFFCTTALAGEPSSTEQLYRDNCAECHGPARLGAIGPSLIPESLGRQKKEALQGVIANGRAQTQMPAFAEALSEDEIAALAEFVMKPLGEMPVWGKAEIEASRTLNADYKPVSEPVFDADRYNLFVVVETGDHHATVLNGDTFEPITRFQTHYALHGGPKFTPDGRYVFFMSRDGWVTKYDLYGLEKVGEVRAAINARNIAISKDGRHLAVANYLPHSLVVLSTDDLSVEKIFEAEDRKGNSSRVSAVYQAPERDSFIVALKDVAEIWEIATDPNAKPVYTGFVHSHEKGMVEALAVEKGLFARRRIEVSEPLDDFFFDPGYRNLIGSARDGGTGVVVNLIVGREIARLPLPGFPHLGSGITWTRQGRPVMATPHLKEAKISVIAMDDWSVLKTIETDGPGFFMRSHENSRYAWTDVFFGPNKDVMHVIDKETLEIVRTLRPEPGKTAAHVEFDREGKHALVSLWEDDGAVIVYDAETLEEVKRLPMRKPSGKYNVWNKITFSEGTSH
ncbi:c-type cytochrome [Rhizobiales bacterium]|uniref:cytochrome D1 domain-containing protein n=1 Tax=Hongsoonwoonella zoysiae TaxID=2821844 RepID=UPI00155F95AC|nr:cytochrome D1 domain-containing protein [Hongsoonwoonella zoysiae]NRG18211.1 c-type cytochrome [Hongsoonwoonella zoysiae]